MKHQIDILRYPLHPNQYYCEYIALCGITTEYADKVTFNPSEVTCKNCLRSKKRRIVEVDWLDREEE